MGVSSIPILGSEELLKLLVELVLTQKPPEAFKLWVFVPEIWVLVKLLKEVLGILAELVLI